MERTEAVQRLLDLFERPSYLEIGVNQGLTFHGVQAHRKVAVDPAFLFDHRAEAKRRPEATYHPVESDRYFATAIGRDERFDVVFLDGLHTYDQTLRDLLNTLQHVHPDSVIVIDDVMPVDYASSIGDPVRMNAFRAAAGDTGLAWMGDVYKVVFFVESFLPQFSFATIAENHGQAVLWRENRPVAPALTGAEIAGLDYGDLVLRRAALNLMPHAEIVERIRRARAGAGP